MTGAELSQTGDPRVLVPGDPAALHAHAAELATHGQSLVATGDNLRRIDTFEGWSGRAAEAFRDKFTPHPAQWLTAGDAHQSAAASVSRYADSLSWAQNQAGTAAHQWQQAQTASQTAAARYNEAAARGGQQAPFVDPGVAARDNAQGLLTNARTQLAGAGDAAAQAINAATENAPQQSFWSRLGGAVEDTGSTALNLASAIGESVADNGPAVFSTAIGAGLTVLSAGGEIGGLALDATGIGAVIGVPAAAVSAAGLAAGIGMMTASMAKIAKDAGDNYRRPSGFRKGVRQQSYDGNKGADAKVRDPKTKEEIKPDDEWDMGHKPGYEFRKHQESARQRDIDRKQFLDEHNTPEHYRPETQNTNRSRSEEDHSSHYKGP